MSGVYSNPRFQSHGTCVQNLHGRVHHQAPTPHSDEIGLLQTQIARLQSSLPGVRTGLLTRVFASVAITEKAEPMVPFSSPMKDAMTVAYETIYHGGFRAAMSILLGTTPCAVSMRTQEEEWRRDTRTVIARIEGISDEHTTYDVSEQRTAEAERMFIEKIRDNISQTARDSLLIESLSARIRDMHLKVVEVEAVERRTRLEAEVKLRRQSERISARVKKQLASYTENAFQGRGDHAVDVFKYVQSPGISSSELSQSYQSVFDNLFGSLFGKK